MYFGPHGSGSSWNKVTSAPQALLLASFRWESQRKSSSAPTRSHIQVGCLEVGSFHTAPIRARLPSCSGFDLPGAAGPGGKHGVEGVCWPIDLVGVIISSHDDTSVCNPYAGDRQQ